VNAQFGFGNRRLSPNKNVKISIMGVTVIIKPTVGSILGLWEIVESLNDLRSGLSLSARELEQYEARKTESRKKEWLACRHLLREMTGASKEILYDEVQKPFLSDPDTHISISHSGSYACVYLNPNQGVGVDIQKLKPSISEGAFFFISDREMEWVDMSDNQMLHLLWSAKEAVFKKVGNKDLDFKNIMVASAPENQNHFLSVSTSSGGLINTHLVAYLLINNHILTWTI
jgi:4'-phosphopantetheinyl transferase